jgi:transcriptional regulator with XRE-family HTH domain
VEQEQGCKPAGSAGLVLRVTLCYMGGNNLKDTGVGLALRDARRALGWNQRQAAEAAGFSNASISRWETGEHSPRVDHLASLLTVLQVPAERRDEIVALHRKRDEPHWVAVDASEQKQQITTLLELERTATEITVVSPLLIPGLLQTADYVRAIMERGGVPADEVTTRVVTRMGRRDAITRKKNPAHLTAVVGESALRQRIGGPAVMLEQLQALPVAAEMPNVDLRVLPDNCDWHPALEGAFVLVEFSDRTPVVQIENRRSAMFFSEPPDIEAYREAAETVLRVAMSPERSAGLIAEVIANAAKRTETTE